MNSSLIASSIDQIIEALLAIKGQLPAPQGPEFKASRMTDEARARMEASIAAQTSKPAIVTSCPPIHMDLD